MSDLPPSLIHPAELPEDDVEEEQEDEINEEDIDEIIEDDDEDFPMDGDDDDQEGDDVPGGIIMEEGEGEDGEEVDYSHVVDNSASQASQSTRARPLAWPRIPVSSRTYADLSALLCIRCSLAALHRDGSSVFDVSLHPLHPNPPLAVSGGEDDLAFLFDTTTGKEIVKLSGHEDSVVATSFSQYSCLAFLGR